MKKNVEILKGGLTEVLGKVESLLEEGYCVEQPLYKTGSLVKDPTGMIIQYAEYLCILTKDTL